MRLCQYVTTKVYTSLTNLFVVGFVGKPAPTSLFYNMLFLGLDVICPAQAEWAIAMATLQATGPFVN